MNDTKEYYLNTTVKVRIMEYRGHYVGYVVDTAIVASGASDVEVLEKLKKSL